jgi:transposase
LIYLAKFIVTFFVPDQFLPPYSFDFNPIENAWSKIKSILGKLKARTFDALKSALSLALNSISLDDILSWLNHCGYSLQ